MDLNNIIVWILLGGIAGWLAGNIMKVTSVGYLGNVIIGVIGSFLGGFLASYLGINGAVVGGLSLASILTAVSGSILLLFLLKLLKR